MSAEPGSRASAWEARWESWWLGPSSLVRLALFRIVMLATALYAVYQYREGVFQHAHRSVQGYVERSWKPIYAFDVLGFGPPNGRIADLLFATTLVAIGCGLAGLVTRASCAIAALGSFLWIGSNYSYGKPHHDCIALVFGLFTLPFAPVGARLSLDALFGRLLRAARGLPARPRAAEAAWAALPLRATQVSVAIGYFFSGASKLAIGGWTWANGYTLQGILLHFDAPWSSAFAQDVFLCRLMSIGILFVQTTFPVVLFWPRLAWFYVPASIAFHLGTWMTMHTGPYLTLWFTLAAFVPLESVPGFLRDRVGRGPLLARLAWALGSGAIAWALAELYLMIFPAWTRPAAVALVAALVAGRVLIARTQNRPRDGAVEHRAA